MFSTKSITLFGFALTLSSTVVAGSNQVVVDGQYRVTALSPTVLRIEPKGPMGFEDRSTFLATGRDKFAGIDIVNSGTSGNKTTLTTSAYTVVLDFNGPAPSDKCGQVKVNTDISGGARISTCSERARSCLPAGATQDDCCAACTPDVGCIAWIYDPNAKNCWLMSRAPSTRAASDRVTGLMPGGFSIGASVFAAGADTATDTPIWSTDNLDAVEQNLIWPAPPAASNPVYAYAIKDYPRFFVPPWAATPIPEDAKVDPALVATNGYDFRNNVNGDTYVFLWNKGGDVPAWHAARRAFNTLAGPTPLLPDYAYGTWFTWWHQYSEAEAKQDVTRWETDKLPIDIWALDMNWRQTPHGHNGQPVSPGGFGDEEHHYDYPNTELFPGLCGEGDHATCAPDAAGGSEWFDWIQSRKLRTYFNDHPFPVNGTAMQTTAPEVAFRWAGLSKWLERGLTFWWFDANWAFSIPPPNVKYGGRGDGAAWEGMDNRVWGSHLYYDTVRVYNENHPTRNHTMPAERPIVLTKYADGNMHPGLVQHQHPAQHRFPVWWTGDGVNLQASVESMVDSGVYDFKPFVHSDCGGDYRGRVGGDLLRWAAHCVFGTILRFHGSDHRPWTYDNATEDGIRSYLQMRYKMLPSLIAAGAAATESAFPIVARGDLYWPEHPEASSNHQYIHLNDTLVAPIWDSSKNETSRSVWVPPGQWTDVWDGSAVTGPKTITVTQPYARQPMWHRAGGLLVLASDPDAMRVEEQDWSEITLEAHPHTTTSHPLVTRRTLRERGSGDRTDIVMTTSTTHPTGTVSRFDISPHPNAGSRAWVIRIHLRPGQKATTASIDGVSVMSSQLTHLAPRSSGHDFLPFGGKDSRPAPLAGHVVQISVPSSASARHVIVNIETE